MAKDIKAALKAHMKKGKDAHPDSAVKGMKKGGPTTDDRMRLGRGLSRAASQKTG
jgi:gluconate kinase